MVRLWLSKEHPAHTDQISSMTVSEEAEVGHAVEAGRQDIQQKSSNGCA